MNETGQPAWNERTTNLDLLNQRSGKENVAGWWGIDTSNEVATGELADNSNFNIIRLWVTPGGEGERGWEINR